MQDSNRNNTYQKCDEILTKVGSYETAINIIKSDFLRHLMGKINNNAQSRANWILLTNLLHKELKIKGLL